MVRYEGMAASKGYATGKIKVINRRIAGFKRVVLATSREKALYEAAIILAKDEIRSLMRSGDTEHRDILNFQLMMLDDNGLNVMIHEHINGGVGAARAVELAMDEYCNRLKNTGDSYLMERTSDIRDALGRVVDILDGRSRERFALSEPCIIVADEILPSDLASIDRKYALAFITVGGSYQSHSNIIARTMGIPSVCGLDSEVLNPLNNGRTACVDGDEGTLVISPDREYLEEFQKKVAKAEQEKKDDLDAKMRPIVLKSGKTVRLYANCNDPRDITAAIENGAEGIGLVRSEILFMKEDYPTYERQLDFYSRCIEAARGRDITIRVFDIGSDKQFGEVRNVAEPNPALGLRGVRLQYRYRELFETQVRALYVAAERTGPVKVMLPMVSTVKDVIDFKTMADSVKDELLSEGLINEDRLTWGVMIETPSAALISDELSELVSFFSIGTNDLVQYTLAADRLNTDVDWYYDPLHPSVMKLVELTAKNAAGAGVDVSICGESARNIECAKRYVAAGVTCLSMAQNEITSMRRKLLEQAETL
ncbi:MAG: phosphoenolpyruvate--protein phosphotransferase [Oscillospiraceae bacterium]|nr:phosphoenolpyruvate--protein phosphotransferase [Oscillospiraceae bacterium]